MALSFTCKVTTSSAWIVFPRWGILLNIINYLRLDALYFLLRLIPLKKMSHIKLGASTAFNSSNFMCNLDSPVFYCPFIVEPPVRVRLVFSLSDEKIFVYLHSLQSGSNETIFLYFTILVALEENWITSRRPLPPKRRKSPQNTKLLGKVTLKLWEGSLVLSRLLNYFMRPCVFPKVKKSGFRV